MINVILNIIILIATIFEFYAVIKDRKDRNDDTFSIKVHKITMITGIILAICWFIEAQFISIRLVPVAYILSFMNVFMVAVEFEYFRMIKKSNETSHETSNENYIDIEIDENKVTNVDNSNNNTIKTIEKH